MVAKDSLTSVHNNLALLSGFGSVSYLFGSVFFMWALNQNKWYDIIGLVLFFGGLISLTLSIGMFREERHEDADTITGLVQQSQSAAKDTSFNEVAVLAGISASFIGISAALGFRQFEKHKNFGMYHVIGYTAGWLGMSLAGSMNRNGLDSVSGQRALFTVPGGFLVILGTLLIPWETKNKVSFGLASPLMAVGLGAFSIGVSHSSRP